MSLDVHPTTMCDLLSGTWYHLKVVALSTAGSSTATYYFSTLTEDGGEALFYIVTVYTLGMMY